MNTPAQCKNCVMFRFCLDAECLKGKPCAYRKEKISEPDLMNEMNERMGWNGRIQIMEETDG